jgi:erythrin-vacuolar iron transport family protein
LRPAQDNYSATAQFFKEMEAEEDTHRLRLIDEFQRRFGDHIPLISRQDVRGFITRKPVWLIQSLGIKALRRNAESMEAETQRFNERVRFENIVKATHKSPAVTQKQRRC